MQTEETAEEGENKGRGRGGSKGASGGRRGKKCRKGQGKKPGKRKRRGNSGRWGRDRRKRGGAGEYKLKNVNQSKEGWEPGGSIEARTCCDAGISSRSPGGPICARAAHSGAAPSLPSSFQLVERLQAAAPGEEGEGEGGEQTGGGVECVQGEGGRGESVSISGSGGGGV